MTKPQQSMKNSVVKRIAVMGAAKTGKTSLISRFLEQPFEEKHCPTVEDYHIGKFYVGETLCHMEITDTSGTFEFPAMERLTMERANAFVFVYSLEDEESFERVKLSLGRLSEVKDMSKIPIIVVCNKADMANVVSLRNMQMRLDNGDMPLQYTLHRECKQIQAEITKEQQLCTQLEYIRALGCEFLMTSAKFRWNVNRIFQQLFAERERIDDSDAQCKKSLGSPRMARRFKRKLKADSRAKSI